MEDLTDLEEFVMKACMKAAGREGWVKFSMYWTLPYVIETYANKMAIQYHSEFELIVQEASDAIISAGWHLIGKDGVEVDFGGQSNETKMAIAKLLGYKTTKLSSCCASAIVPEADICSQCKEHCEIVEV